MDSKKFPLESISSEATAKLSPYVDILLKWNSKINLIGKSTEEEIWDRHIADSLQLLEHIPQDTKTITDLGSGAGLPGLILAIANPETEVHLIESDSRKTAFLTEAARICKANVKIHNERIEKITPWKSDVVTARALADINQLLVYASPFFTKDSLCLLLKGSNVETELQKAKRNWEFDFALYPSITGDGFVTAISNVRKK